MSMDNHQSFGNKGPAIQHPQQPAPSLWNHAPVSTGWNPRGVSTSSYEVWNQEPPSSATVGYGAEDVPTNISNAPVFDPFNSLDINRIWNPFSSDAPTGFSGWSLGMGPQHPDKN